MKLYWKVFLVSLVLIMAAVGITAYSFLHYSLSVSMDSVTDKAVTTHSYIAVSLKNNAEYQRVKNDNLILDCDDMKTAVSFICDSLSSVDCTEPYGVYINVSGKDYHCDDGFNKEKIDTSVFAEQPSADKCLTYISREDAESYIEVYSVIETRNYSASVYSLYDISNIYEEYEKEFDFALFMSVIFSVAAALVLYILTYFLLRPLKKVNDALDRISHGEYNVRVPEQGGEEFRQMKKNVNDMAEAVEKNVKRLENVAEGRKQYVDRLAHEMKTPLTSILCFADLLRIKKNVSDEERIEYAGIIVDEAKRMKNMSSKLLELAVAESAEIELEPTSITEMLEETVTALGPGFEASGIKLQIKEDAAEGIILCDKELFKSLIYNICDNARKASEKGQTVTLTCRKKNGMVLIFVIDRGIGMTKDTLKKVTKPFYMADKSKSRKEGGAGIGLSLCMEIAKLHNAKISAKSHPGKGTTFIVSVPEVREVSGDE